MAQRNTLRFGKHCGTGWSIFSVAGVALLAVAAEAAGPFVFRDMLAASGISFRHTDGSSGQRFIVETVTAGLATFDYNGDGLIDIYFVNGAPLKGARMEPAPRDALYRNDGHWHFTDVTEEAGVGDTGFGLGVAVADYDNDGDPDLYVNNFGPNVFYRNNGDGTFSDFTVPAGLAIPGTVGAGAAFLDADADGDLELYVGNYVSFTYENHVPRSMDGYPQYAGPKDYAPEPDLFYRNNGDGTFSEISLAAGIGALAGTSMGMVCADIEPDGDTDIFVLNDVAGNYLFQNDGTGRFEEISLLAGIGFNLDGHELGAMGVDCADYDNDGLLDFFMTSYAGEYPVLYRNLGGAAFADVTLTSGAGAGCFPHVNWGNGFADFDHDGYRDLFVANGHLQDNIRLYDETTSFEVTNVLLRNRGDGRFVDVSSSSGEGLQLKLSSRGAALDDLDNDGDVDIVVLNSRREPSVLRNDSPRAGRHWMQVQLQGGAANRDGVGARVILRAGDLTLVDEVHSGRGYQGHFGTRLHFGLGPRDRVDRLEVRWIGGGIDVLEGLPADRLVKVVEATRAGPRQE